MKWEDRSGTEILARYPKDLNVRDQTLMQVYRIHEYSAEVGMISLMVGALNIASYYTGSEQNLYLLLLLKLDDDPDSFEGALAEVARIIQQNIEEGKYIGMIPSLFQRISLYPSLNEEQQLAMTYHDEMKRAILNRLQEEGVVSKSELTIWLKDKFNQVVIDLDTIIVDLIKRELIKEFSVKGMSSELVFLINDLLILRIPPVEIFNKPVEKGLPKQLEKEYKRAVINFFTSYKTTEFDNLKLIDAILDPQVYETLRLIRTAVVTKQDVEKLMKKYVEDVDKVIGILWENNLIEVFQEDQNNEYYGMISDFKIKRIFPKYLLNMIKDRYESKSKSDEVLLEYLNVIEDAYTAEKERLHKM